MRLKLQQLNAIPGIVMLVVIFSPLLILVAKPHIAQIIVLLYILYWTYRTGVFTFGNIVGITRLYFTRQKHTITLQDYSIQHAIIIPVYKESLSVVIDTLKSIYSQSYPLHKIVICVSIERRKCESLTQVHTFIEKLSQTVPDALKNNTRFTIHIDSPDQAKGAAANRTWATKILLAELEILHKNPEDFILTSIDADTKLDVNYLETLTDTYYKTRHREQRFYMPSYYFVNSKYWSSSPFIRILSTGLTMSILASSSVQPNSRFTFSCFSLHLPIIQAVDFWDTSISIDDTPFYWRPFQHFEGDWHSVSVASGVTLHAVSGEGFLDSLRKQYQQLYRWGWGIVAFPIGLRVLLKMKTLSLQKKLRTFIHMMDQFIFVKTASLAITITSICLKLDTEIVSDAGTIGEIITLLVLINLACSIFVLACKLLLLLTFTDKPNSFIFIIQFLFEIPISIITVLLFGTVPYVHASLDMLLNVSHDAKIKWTQKE